MSLTIAMLSIHTSPLDSPGRTKDAGGMNVYIRELAQKLVSHHLTIDIFTRWTDEQTPQIVQLSPYVRVIHIKAGPIATLHKNELYQHTPTFARHIDEFRQRESINYDIIHSHYWLSGVAAMRLACHWKVPHITMFHTLARMKLQANPDEQETQMRLEMEQQLIHRADRIIAATAEERTQMIRYAGATASQVEIVPCGVDLNLFVERNQLQARKQLGWDMQGHILLFAGRLDPFKGPDVLLRTAALMQNEAQVIIAGGKPGNDLDIQKLQDLAHELNISHRVHFLGARPREEMPLLYSAADITVVPSYHESFGLAAVESLACGTPVVATRAGGLTTVVRDGETGFLVPRCPGFFAERLDLLLNDPELCLRMKLAARPSVLQFSWRNVADRIYQIYDNVVCEEHCLIAQ